MSRDRRTWFANERIAHVSLRGQVEVALSEGTPCRVAAPVTNLHAAPGSKALDRQVLHGHPVCLLDERTGFARDDTSGHVGYLNPADLTPWQAPTHRVTARSTLLFCSPDFKAPAPTPLPCGALVTITATDGIYAETDDGRFAIAAHLRPADIAQPDFAATAEKLIGTPYLWGGNSAFGIDCSGLVQLSLQSAGADCPGDSDQQMQVGAALPAGTPPQRNDLMFWKGHVAIVYDPDTLIHANAYHMAVALEPLDAAITRIETQGDGPVTGHRRL